MTLRKTIKRKAKPAPKAKPKSAPKRPLGLVSLGKDFGSGGAASRDDRGDRTDPTREEIDALSDRFAGVSKEIEGLSNQVAAVLNFMHERFNVRVAERGSGALRSRLPKIESTNSTPINANARREAGQEQSGILDTLHEPIAKESRRHLQSDRLTHGRFAFPRMYEPSAFTADLKQTREWPRAALRGRACG